MNSYAYRFENILTYQEQKRDESEATYKRAVETFEKDATELYHLLKKKEDTVAEQQEKLMTGLTIEQMHYYIHYIDQLEREVEHVQKKVVESRARMEWFEEKLLEDTIEVKKYEKMKEKDRQHYEKELEQLEMIRLDELSTQSFSRKESEW